MNPPNNPVFCAIDTGDLDAARALVTRILPYVGGIKLGLEFYVAHGKSGVMGIAETGCPIFLDLKFHDIPNTVAGAVRSAIESCGDALSLMTVHCSGGRDMCRAASDSAKETAERLNITAPRIVGVTILTSLDITAIQQIGYSLPMEAQVLRIAALGIESGLDGLVCSPHEIAMLRKELGSAPTLVVPGIRPAGSDAGDQKRIMTPADALSKGADILVIGRPITQANAPEKAAEDISNAIMAG